MRKRNFKIGKLEIGLDKKTIIVAELSGNHKGKISYAKKLIKMAKKSGADAVKLQSYTANSITLDVKKKDFEIEGSSPWAKHTYLWDLYKKAETPISWHKKLFDYARKINIEIFSSPFDENAVDFLEKLNCPAYKVASPEINHFPLLKKIAKTKKPIILSSGLSTFSDIKKALKYLQRHGSKKIILLKCTSAYPAKLSDLNLKTINDFKKKFNLIPGFSDHSEGIIAPITACSLGAKMIEKHFKLNNSKSVDSFFSLSPNSFKKMVNGIRDCEEASGKISYNIPKNAKKSLIGRRSIYVVRDIDKGELFTNNNIRVIRPNLGLSPIYYETILKGKFKSKKKLYKGDRFKLNYIKK